MSRGLVTLSKHSSSRGNLAENPTRLFCLYNSEDRGRIKTHGAVYVPGAAGSTEESMLVILVVAGAGQYHSQFRLHRCGHNHPQDCPGQANGSVELLRKQLPRSRCQCFPALSCSVYHRLTTHTGPQISLNATIAALITAAKSTAMLSVAACISQWKWAYFRSNRRRLADLDIIEEASRGPLGSVQMLTSVTWGLGTLGAIVTIVALGIDTFAQQVISTDAVTRWTDDGTASFGLAHSYNGSARSPLENAPGGTGNDWEPDRTSR